MKKTLFIFDIDGTLTQSCNAHQEAYYQTCLDFFKQSDIDTSDWHEVEHYTDSCFFIHACKQLNYSNISEEAFQEFENKCYLHFIKNYKAKLIDGVEEFLEKLIANKIPFVMATGSTNSLAVHKLKRLKLNTALLASSNLNFITRESIVENAIEKAKNYYNVDSFERFISIGDGLWDYKTAKKMKLDFIAIGDKLNENPMQDESVACHLDYTNLKLENI